MNYPDDTGTGTGREVRCNMSVADDILPDVKHYLPGCNVEITMRKAIATAIQNFCRETGVFIYKTDDITVVDAQREYEITLPYKADILMFRELTQHSLDSDGNKVYPGNKLHPTQYEVEDDLQDYNISIALRSPLGASETAQSVLVADLSLIPQFDSLIDAGGCALPNKFMQRWRQAFVSGALMDLAMMTQEQWSNKGLADRNADIYSSLTVEAIDKASVSKMIQGSGSMLARTPWV